jgi:hypothetical protein
MVESRSRIGLSFGRLALLLAVASCTSAKPPDPTLGTEVLVLCGECGNVRSSTLCCFPPDRPRCSAHGDAHAQGAIACGLRGWKGRDAYYCPACNALHCAHVQTVSDESSNP